MLRRSEADAGASLVEAVAALAILGIAVVAMLGALGVLSDGSRRHRQHVNVNLVLETAAERIKASPLECPSSVGTAYTAALTGLPAPSDWTAAPTVEVVALSNLTSAGALALSCPSALQLVTVQAKGPDGSTDRLAFVKGRSLTGNAVTDCQVTATSRKLNFEFGQVLTFPITFPPGQGCLDDVPPLVVAPSLPTVVADHAPPATWCVKIHVPEAPAACMTGCEALVLSPQGAVLGVFDLTVGPVSNERNECSKGRPPK